MKHFSVRVLVALGALALSLSGVSVDAQPAAPSAKPPSAVVAPSQETVAKVKALYDAADALFQQQQLLPAKAGFEAALAEASQSLPSGHVLTGIIHLKLGAILLMQQEFEPALANLNQGIVLLDGNPRTQPIALQAKTLVGLLKDILDGLAFINTNDYPGAEQVFAKAIPAARSLQQPAMLSLSLSCMGLAQVMQDRLEEARTSLQEALQLADLPEARLMAQISLSALASKEGEIARAIEYDEMALAENEAVFQRLNIDKALFRQDIARLNLVQKELDKSKSAPQAQQYVADALMGGTRVLRWNEKNGVLRLYLASGNDIPGWKPEFAEAFKRACRVWQEVLDNKIRFEFTENPSEKVDSRLEWHNRYAERAGLTSYVVIGPQLAKADIEINLKNYNNELYDENTLYKLFLHEIGHLLGIVGHSNNPHDVMFPTPTTARTLSARDIETIRELYARKPHISNPPDITLGEYRESKTYRNMESLVEVLDHF